MLRQFRFSSVLAVAALVATLAGVTACGIKGPLRPAPKAGTWSGICDFSPDVTIEKGEGAGRVEGVGSAGQGKN
jgi:predicted small lipoprotein YifL